jgi:hypothetical protein
MREAFIGTSGSSGQFYHDPGPGRILISAIVRAMANDVTNMGHREAEIRSHVVAQGAVCFLKKPLEGESLSRCIEQRIESQHR